MAYLTTFQRPKSLTMATYSFPSGVFISVISVNHALWGLPTLNRCLIRLGAARHSGLIVAVKIRTFTLSYA
jgi:hypothetical protein